MSSMVGVKEGNGIEVEDVVGERGELAGCGAPTEGEEGGGGGDGLHVGRIGGRSEENRCCSQHCEWGGKRGMCVWWCWCRDVIMTMP